MIPIKFKDAPWWQATLGKIGEEKTHLLLIDNFSPKPEILVQDAVQRIFSANAPYYPGIRAPTTPGEYFNPLMKALSEALVNIFNYNAGVSLQECYYSLVITKGQNLNMVQRVPHVDGGNDRKVALLHYLCKPEHGGTSFYRQNRTSFETVTHDRFKAFNAALEEDYEDLGPSNAEYYAGDDNRFENIHKVEAKFNRAIMYFGCNLHSINIINDAILNSDPRLGRLTINTFLNPL